MINMQLVTWRERKQLVTRCRCSGDALRIGVSPNVTVWEEHMPPSLNLLATVRSDLEPAYDV